MQYRFLEYISQMQRQLLSLLWHRKPLCQIRIRNVFSAKRTCSPWIISFVMLSCMKSISVLRSSYLIFCFTPWCGKCFVTFLDTGVPLAALPCLSSLRRDFKSALPLHETEMYVPNLQTKHSASHSFLPRGIPLFCCQRKWYEMSCFLLKF